MDISQRVWLIRIMMRIIPLERFSRKNIQRVESLGARKGNGDMGI